MDSEFWREAVKQIPALTVMSAVLLLAIYRFLRSMRQMSDDGRQVLHNFLAFVESHNATQRQRDTEQAIAVRAIGDTCHVFQRDLSARHEQLSDRVALALDNNSEALGRNTEALRRVETVADRTERAIEDVDRIMRERITTT